MPLRVFDTPLGPMLAREEEGALAGLDFLQTDSAVPASDRTALLLATEEQISAYFEGRLRVFDLPLHLRGSSFRQAVWSRLLAIPYGKTASYGQIARELGKPAAVRAVGGANHHNPISIIVPCHRVIGSDGALTGYGGGLWRKQALLDLERGKRFDRPISIG